jgi:hypothetical protein
MRTAANLSPNNHGFAMAVSLPFLNVPVTLNPLKGRGKPPIDNKPTPSYLSPDPGLLRLSRRSFGQNCLKSAVFRSAGGNFRPRRRVKSPPYQ